MNWDLRGRVALVTGGSKGLGFATASRFAQAGATVAILARQKSRLDAARDEIVAQHGGRVEAFACDVTDPASVASTYAAITEAVGSVDILFNNAGQHAHAHSLELSDEQWQADLDLKLMATVRFSRLAMPGMIARRWGRIINIVNTLAKAPGAETAPTSVSRAAQMAFTKVLAGEGGPHNVLVNAIAVGLIHSDQLQRAHAAGGRHQTYEEFTSSMANKLRIPLGRVGKAGELADVVCFLSSDASSYVTGTVLNVDGGMCPIY